MYNMWGLERDLGRQTNESALACWMPEYIGKASVGCLLYSVMKRLIIYCLCGLCL